MIQMDRLTVDRATPDVFAGSVGVSGCLAPSPANIGNVPNPITSSPGS
ncbi:MAG: hypothetical protein OS112_06730 [Methanoregula sp.]|nr:MAG: hypothetical protein OS112_06730 [Methanoregula sp.]